MSVAQRYIKGSDFSESFVKKFKGQFPLNQYFKITPVSIEELEFDDEGNPMPPEEDFRDEFIAEVQASRENYQKGHFVHCETKEESDKLLAEIWNQKNG